MPTFNGDKFLEYIKQLLLLDKDWIPDKKGYSLYIRPTMIATEPVLGVHPAEEVLLYVITCPVGPYYPTGFKPVALYADSKAVRAWPGGTGGYKIGANYAPGIAPALEAAAKGYQQILWLHEDKITEVGTMNLFCLWINKEGKKELITAPLDGQILPGVTRKSILELTREWNQFLVSEKEWDMKSLIQALKEGRVIEMFGAGTAAIVSPVYKIFYQGKDHSVPCKDNAGELTSKLMESLLSIQYGETNSPWSVIVG
jgi:branched-chain amino acid aminotransferase